MGEIMKTEAGTLSKRERQKQEARSRQLRKRLITIGSIVLAVLILGGLGFAASGAINRVATAAEVDGERYSPAEFNYYYYAAFSNAYSGLQQSYGDSASYFLNPEKPLDEQAYMEGATWADYLQGQALNNIRDAHMLYEEAQKEGFQLDEEEQEQLDAAIASVKDIAAQYGFSANGYLSQVYGDGMNMKIYAREMNRSFVASAYAAKINESLEPDMDAIEAGYAEDPNAYDKVTFRTFFLSGTYTPAEGEELTEEEQIAANESAKDEAKTKAEAFVNHVKDGSPFADEALNYAPESTRSYYEDENYTLKKGYSYSNVSASAYGDWLFDAARAEGDVEAFETDNGWYVVQFQSRDDNRYETVSVRHILITPELAEGETEATEEAWAAAKEQAEAIMEQWQADPTEENFITLANENSADSDGTDGGLYENIYKDQMVPGFNEWIFDEARAEGDCELVKTDYGWHLIYFVGRGEEYRIQIVRDTLQSNAYSDWAAERVEGKVCELKKGVKYAGGFVG